MLCIMCVICQFGATFLSAEGYADTVLKLAQEWIGNAKAINHVVLLPEIATNYLSVNRVIAFVSTIVRTSNPTTFFVFQKIFNVLWIIIGVCCVRDFW